MCTPAYVPSPAWSPAGLDLDFFWLCSRLFFLDFFLTPPKTCIKTFMSELQHKPWLLATLQEQ